MANSTSTQRQLFAPACKSKGDQYRKAYEALDAVLKKWGYQPRSGVTGAYNCRTITGGTGYSLHAYGPGTKFVFWNGVSIAMSLAVDINWDKNPYGKLLITDMPRGMVNEIEAIRSNTGKQVWRWGGYYTGNKDAMHFEIVCGPADLTTGIKTNGQTTEPTPVPYPIEEEEDMNIVIRGDQTPEIWITDGITKRWGESFPLLSYGHHHKLWKAIDDSGNPLVLNQGFVDSIPTVVTEAWINKIANDVMVKGIANRDSIIKAVNDSNTSGGFSEAQVDIVIQKLKIELDKLKNLDLSDEDKKALASLTAKAVIDEISS